MVTVDERGVIADIDTCPRVDSLRGVEYYNGVIIPAMTNAHCHLELSYMRGRIVPGGGLAAFVRGIERVRADVEAGAILPADISGAAAYWDARMAGDGVGLVGDICNDNVIFDTKIHSSVRYRSFVELFGLMPGAAERGRALLDVAAQCGLVASATPHSTYSLSDADFASAVGGLGTNNSPLSIHFMEDEGEAELFRRRGTIWEWYRGQGIDRRPGFDFLHWGSSVERVIGQVPPGRRTMLIHNTFIGADELATLQRHFGDNLTLVLCPRSNRYITGQLPPVEMVRRSGVRIAVGTDSLASNASLSLVDELKMFHGVPLEELLRWATAAGAEALGCQDECGTIEVGRPARLALLEGVDFATLKLHPDATTRSI